MRAEDLFNVGSRIRYAKNGENWTGTVIGFDRSNGVDFLVVDARFGGARFKHSVRAVDAQVLKPYARESKPEASASSALSTSAPEARSPKPASGASHD